MIVKETFLKDDVNRIAEDNRQYFYKKEADPLYMQMQRGEVTMEEWQSKIDEIKAKFPYVDEDLVLDVEYPETETAE